MDSTEEHPDVQQPHAPSPMVWVELLVRVSVGCLLIFSGTIKLQDLNSFIGSLNTMELPLLSSNAGLLGLFADSLPWFEIGLGVFLVLGICARGATIVAAGLFIIFTRRSQISFGNFDICKGRTHDPDNCVSKIDCEIESH